MQEEQEIQAKKGPVKRETSAQMRQATLIPANPVVCRNGNWGAQAKGNISPKEAARPVGLASPTEADPPGAATAALQLQQDCNCGGRGGGGCRVGPAACCFKPLRLQPQLISTTRQQLPSSSAIPQHPPYSSCHTPHSTHPNTAAATPQHPPIPCLPSPTPTPHLNSSSCHSSAPTCPCLTSPTLQPHTPPQQPSTAAAATPQHTPTSSCHSSTQQQLPPLSTHPSFSAASHPHAPPQQQLPLPSTHHTAAATPLPSSSHPSLSTARNLAIRSPGAPSLPPHPNSSSSSHSPAPTHPPVLVRRPELGHQVLHPCLALLAPRLLLAVPWDHHHVDIGGL